MQELQPDPTIAPVTETRDYLGGLEFVNGLPETYNFGDGRVVWLPEPHPVTGNPVPTPRVQFRLHDHLGNTVVFFWDKNNDGCVDTEEAGADSEILQRLLYYPFGMPMEGLSYWSLDPEQAYRYNGKERDTISGWYEYGFRWYDAGIGRFTGVDPIADKFAWVSVYNYAENEPVGHIDLWGLQKHKIESPKDLFSSKMPANLLGGAATMARKFGEVFGFEGARPDASDFHNLDHTHSGKGVEILSRETFKGNGKLALADAEQGASAIFETGDLVPADGGGALGDLLSANRLAKGAYFLSLSTGKAADTRDQIEEKGFNPVKELEKSSSKPSIPKKDDVELRPDTTYMFGSSRQTRYTEVKKEN